MLAVFDLDGTLISKNSFHLWLLYLLRWGILKFRWGVVIKIFYLLCLRSLKYISHVELKKTILSISLQIPEADRALFSKRLFGYVRPELLDRIAAHKKEGFTVIIATAALEIYLIGFDKLCGVDKVLATGCHLSESWRENLKEEKVINIIKEYGKNVVIGFAYSDHRDDLPLLAVAKQAVVVAPTDKDWLFLKEQLLNCQRLL